MATEYSPLTLVLTELLERGFGVTATDEVRGFIELAVNDHDLDGDKAPAWLFEFLSRILNRRMTSRAERYKIPSGYPTEKTGYATCSWTLSKNFTRLDLMSTVKT